MKALTEAELDFLAVKGQYSVVPNWQPYEWLNRHPDAKSYRKRYSKLCQRLVRRGFIKITKPGMRVANGYQPAEWDYTPLGEQIAGLVESLVYIQRKLSDVQKSIARLRK